MGKFKQLSFSSEQECKDKVLEFLLANRSRNEISTRTGQTPDNIEKWAKEWREAGLLPESKRRAMGFIHAARLASNGYYQSIRKRYASMIWNDKINNREFGFNSPLEAVPYYLDNGNPRPCTYCGLLPPEGKVWGLDRLNSDLGHQPGNLVPCCGSTGDGSQMMCQASKSKYSLRSWLAVNIARAFGRPATEDEVETRASQVEALAAQLVNLTNELEVV